MNRLVEELLRLRRICHACRWVSQDPILDELRGLTGEAADVPAPRVRALVLEFIDNQLPQTAQSIEEHRLTLERLAPSVDALPLEQIRAALTQNLDGFLENVADITAGCMADREERFRAEYDKLLEQLTAGVEAVPTEKMLDAWLLEDAPGLLEPVSRRLCEIYAMIPDIYVAGIKSSCLRYEAQQNEQLRRIDDIFFPYLQTRAEGEGCHMKIPSVAASVGKLWAELGLYLAPWIGGKPSGIFRRSRRIPAIPGINLRQNKDFLKKEFTEKLHRLSDTMCESARETGEQQLFQIHTAARSRHDILQGYLDIRCDELAQYEDRIEEEYEKERELLQALQSLKARAAAL